MSDYEDLNSDEDEPVFEEPNSDTEVAEVDHEDKKSDDEDSENASDEVQLIPDLPIPDLSIDDVYIVHGDTRITSSIISLEEITRVIGTRATQIDNGAEPYVDHTDLKNTISMALKEVYERKCPLSIRRELNATTVEEWAVNEMELPNGYKENNPVV